MVLYVCASKKIRFRKVAENEKDKKNYFFSAFAFAYF